ncbi:MAG: hypothetical protein ACKOX6_16885 [Bdellovibrio sp.]
MASQNRGQMPMPNKSQETPKSPEVIPSQEPAAPTEDPKQDESNGIKAALETEKKKAVTEQEKFKELKASLPAGKPLDVIATRAGFYGMERKVEGDKFTIKGPEELGSWMKPI